MSKWNAFLSPKVSFKFLLHFLWWNGQRIFLLRKLNNCSSELELYYFIINIFFHMSHEIFFQHEKRNFVSPSGHVMFYLLYKHQWLTVVFSAVVALLGAFNFNAILRSHFLLLLLIFNIRWTLLIITLVIGSIFYILVAFLLFSTFCSWLNLYRFLTLQVHLETYSAHEAW